MAGDTFLRITDIPGESTDDAYKDWIEVLSYEQGVEQAVSYTASSSGGASAERANVGPLTITKEADMATPKLFAAATTGKHIKEVVIEVCRAGGDKQRYITIKMEQVLISAFKHIGGAGVPVERVTFAPGRISYTYSKQQRADGQLGGNVVAGWDLTTNKPFA